MNIAQQTREKQLSKGFPENLYVDTLALIESTSEDLARSSVTIIDLPAVAFQNCGGNPIPSHPQMLEVARKLQEDGFVVTFSLGEHLSGISMIVGW